MTSALRLWVTFTLLVAIAQAQTFEPLGSDFRKMRGVNFIPTYQSILDNPPAVNFGVASSAALWRFYDQATTANEVSAQLQYLKGMGVNLVRVWLSFPVWEDSPVAMTAKWNHFLGLCDSLGMHVMPVLWGSHDFSGGTAPDYGDRLGLAPPYTNIIQWIPNPGGARIAGFSTGTPYDLTGTAAETYLNDLVGAGANHPCVAIWDIMNEPAWGQQSIVPFITESLRIVKAIDPNRKTTVGAAAWLPGLQQEIQVVQSPHLDVLSIHPYSHGRYMIESMVKDCRQIEMNARSVTTPTMPVIATELGAPSLLMTYQNALNYATRVPDGIFGDGIGFCLFQGIIGGGNHPYSKGGGLFFFDGTVRDPLACEAFRRVSIDQGIDPASLTAVFFPSTGTGSGYPPFQGPAGYGQDTSYEKLQAAVMEDLTPYRMATGNLLNTWLRLLSVFEAASWDAIFVDLSPNAPFHLTPQQRAAIPGYAATIAQLYGSGASNDQIGSVFQSWQADVKAFFEGVDSGPYHMRRVLHVPPGTMNAHGFAGGQQTPPSSMNVRGPFSNVAGFTLPSGREILAIGAYDGILMVDANNPSERWFWSDPAGSSTHRGVNGFKNHLFAVSFFGSTLERFTFTESAGAVTVQQATVANAPAAWTSMHITIDELGQRLMLCSIAGSVAPLRLFDVDPITGSLSNQRDWPESGGPSVAGLADVRLRETVSGRLLGTAAPYGFGTSSFVIDLDTINGNPSNPAQYVGWNDTGSYSGAVTRDGRLLFDSYLDFYSLVSDLGTSGAYEPTASSGMTTRPPAVGVYPLDSRPQHFVTLLSDAVYSIGWSKGIRLLHIERNTTTSAFAGLSEFATFDTLRGAMAVPHDPAPGYLGPFDAKFDLRSGRTVAADRQTGLHLLEVDVGQLQHFGQSTGVDGAGRSLRVSLENGMLARRDASGNLYLELTVRGASAADTVWIDAGFRRLATTGPGGYWISSALRFADDHGTGPVLYPIQLPLSPAQQPGGRTADPYRVYRWTVPNYVASFSSHGTPLHFQIIATGPSGVRASSATWWGFRPEN